MEEYSYIESYFGTVKIDQDKLLDVCDTLRIVPKEDASKDVDLSGYRRNKTVVDNATTKARQYCKELKRLDDVTEKSAFVSKKYGFTYSVFYHSVNEVYFGVRLFTEKKYHGIGKPKSSVRPDFSHISEALLEDTAQFRTGDFAVHIVVS